MTPLRACNDVTIFVLADRRLCMLVDANSDAGGDLLLLLLLPLLLARLKKI